MAVTPGNRALFGSIYQPLADYLTRAAGLAVRAVIPEGYDALIDGVVEGRGATTTTRSSGG